MIGRVLIVAGSDSSGGAGIQADVKTVTALGGYAATAISALTAQNTCGVLAVVGVAPEFIARQMNAVLDDIGADCIKTGMLHNSGVIETVTRLLTDKVPQTPLVADPVMFAKGGEALLEPAARDTLIKLLITRATLLTPNVPEAEALSAMAIRNHKDMKVAARRLLALGPAAVLLKGGHLQDAIVPDVLVTQDEEVVFEATRLNTAHTHGTGCTLASATAVGLAQGMMLRAAVARALAYVHEAIRTAPGLGAGRGPLNHGHTVRQFTG